MNQDINVFDVQMIAQKTHWECGYQVLKETEILMNNDCIIDRLETFDYTELMVDFI